MCSFVGKKMSSSFSVIMPIHNEEDWLPLSLPSVYKLKPSEVILFFDRCTDKSIKVAQSLAKSHGMLEKTRLVNVHADVDGFTMRFAYMRWLACMHCRTDIVLITGADLILDRKISTYITLLNDKVRFVNFSYLDYPVNPRNLLKRLMTKIFPMIGGERWLSGVHAFFKSAMFECENLEELKTLEGAQDTHIHKAIQKRYLTTYVNTNTKHLRPKESGARHYFRGTLYWRSAKRGFFITLLSALSMFRLNLIKGYIHERYGK